MSEALLQRIVESPYDEALRDAYVAALEAGHPRAQLVALDRAGTMAAWNEAYTLRKAHPELDPHIAGMTVQAYRSGFADRIWTTGAAFLAGADQLYREAPASEIVLSRATLDELKLIAQLPALRFVRSLVLPLASDALGDDAVRVLVGSPCAKLVRLEAWRSRLTVEGVRLLRSWPQLTHLALGGNALDLEAASMVLSAFPALEVLSLRECALPAGLGAVLWSSPATARLHELELWGNALRGTLPRELPAYRVRKLGLAQCGLSEDDATVIASCGAFDQLEQLDLRENGLHARAFVAGARLPALRELDLRKNAIDHDGATQLAGSDLPKLETLGLDENPIYVPGATEAWRDWEGSVVGEGPVHMTLPQLATTFGRRFKII